MPTGLSREPTLLEDFRGALGPVKSYALGVAMGLAGAGIAGWAISGEARLHRQTEAQIEIKARELWLDNGYDVVGFKSYEVISPRDRTITLVLRNPNDGKNYEGTALCSKSCAVRSIRTLDQ
jgi:hypothetical protein